MQHLVESLPVPTKYERLEYNATKSVENWLTLQTQLRRYAANERKKYTAEELRAKNNILALPAPEGTFQLQPVGKELQGYKEKTISHLKANPELLNVVEFPVVVCPKPPRAAAAKKPHDNKTGA